jgi:hypothetical protein
MTLISKTLLKLGLAAQRNHRWERHMILLGLLCLLFIQLRAQPSNGVVSNSAAAPCLGSNAVQWRDLVGMSVNADNSLTKSSSAGDGWNAGAASENMLEAGQDGWIEWVGISFVMGLSYVNTDAGETFIDYAMSGTATANQLALKEKGVIAAYLDGFQYSDVFRIERVGATSATCATEPS